jgi:hypothetical protein
MTQRGELFSRLFSETTIGTGASTALHWRIVGQRACTSTKLIDLMIDQNASTDHKCLCNALELLDPVDAGLVILIPWKSPPQCHDRDDGTAVFFAAKGLRAPLDEYLRKGVKLEELAYHLVQQIADGVWPVGALYVRQYHTDEDRNKYLMSWGSPCCVIVPHRGPAALLKVMLTYLKLSVSPTTRVLVGLDDTPTPEYHELINDSWVAPEFYYVKPSPSGCYAVRDALTKLSEESILILQDSDDIPCTDRITAQLQYLEQSQAGIVGCHELRVDEINKALRIRRFPLNVNRSMEIEPNHALLHATTAIRKLELERAGGFSTNLPFASDTQFLLRCSFLMQVRNMDSFLYLRRRRVGSLTTSVETGLGSPVRSELTRTWYAAFSAISKGEQLLEDSVLARKAGRRPCKLVRVRRQD